MKVVGINKPITLVSSYPKSGSTFFRFLMYTCNFGYLEKSGDIGPYYPEIERKDIVQRKVEKQDPFFVKSHYPYFEEHPFLDSVSSCVYIVRNPVNTMMSRINHYILEGAKWVDSDWGRNRLIKSFIKEANAKSRESHENRFDGGWNNHVISWLKENRSIPVYLIKYEDLVNKTEAVIKKVNTDLELGFSDENISKGIEISSFANMQRIEDKEIMGEIPGMFYTKIRKKKYLSDGRRFVSKASIETNKEISEKILEQVKESFSEGIKLSKYDI